MNDIVKRAGLKVTSGRWILTMACAFCLIYGTIKDIIPTETLCTIIGMVFISYFQRDKTASK